MSREGMQARFWFLAAVVLIAIFWVLKPMLLPFLLGTALAYFLNPVVDKLEARGVPRWACALIVLCGFGLILVALGLLIVPLLQSQVGAFINAVPGYIEKARTHVIPSVENWLARFSENDVQDIRDAAGSYIGNVAGFAANALKNLVTDSLAIIDVIALLIITPVVAFYLMRDWPLVIKSFDALIPRRHYETVIKQLRRIDASLSGFVRGQALVCLALGIVYSLGLTLVGLQYGLAIGVAAGIMSFVPYVGTGFAWLSSIALALVQFDNFERLGLVITVLMIGHILESYVLTPRLVGERVGLHPVWILFALIAGGRLAGFTGILVAVPVAAVLGVLIRFAIQQYRASSLYKDPLAPNRP